MDPYSRQQAEALGHEPLQTDVRAVWTTAAVLTGVVVAAFLVIIALMNWFGATRIGPRAVDTEAKSDPKWNVPPQVEQLRTRERMYMDNYHWVDQTAGVARVPIDRALQMIEQNGLPQTIGATPAPPLQSNDEQ